MTLEIIMPHYNEDWSIVEPYFDMLKCQRDVDFSEIIVRIVHDGTKHFPQKYFRNLPFKVVQNSIPHTGVSAARNFGMDRADAKWILFSDCDDRFSTVYSLQTIMSVTDTEDFDMLWFDMFVEDSDGPNMRVRIRREHDFVWIHNKLYRLDFLRRNNLRFCEDLYMSEDSAFNSLVGITIGEKRIGHIESDMPLYVWCYREGSVTLDTSKIMRNIIGHHMRNLYVLDEFRKRKHNGVNAIAVRVLTDAYTHMTRNDLPEDKEGYREMIIDYVLKEKDAISGVSEKQLEEVLAASENEAKGCGFLNPDRPTLKEFVRDLLKEKDVKSG